MHVFSKKRCLTKGKRICLGLPIYGQCSTDQWPFAVSMSSRRDYCTQSFDKRVVVCWRHVVWSISDFVEEIVLSIFEWQYCQIRGGGATASRGTRSPTIHGSSRTQPRTTRLVRRTKTWSTRTKTWSTTTTTTCALISRASLIRRTRSSLKRIVQSSSQYYSEQSSPGRCTRWPTTPTPTRNIWSDRDRVFVIYTRSNECSFQYYQKHSTATWFIGSHEVFSRRTRGGFSSRIPFFTQTPQCGNNQHKSYK